MGVGAGVATAVGAGVAAAWPAVGLGVAAERAGVELLHAKPTVTAISRPPHHLMNATLPKERSGQVGVFDTALGRLLASRRLCPTPLRG